MMKHRKGRHAPIPAQKPKRSRGQGATPSSFLPPSARMQKIKKAAGAPVQAPRVEEAKPKAAAAPPKAAAPKPPKKAAVPKPAPKAAAPKPVEKKPAPAPAPKPVVESKPAPAPKVEEPKAASPSLEEALASSVPEWSPKMLKADLLKIAQDAGLDVDDDNTKKEIVKALESLES